MTNEVLTVMWRDVQLFVVIACYFAVGFAVWAILIIGPRKTATSICNLVMGWWRRAAELLAERRSRLEREQINQFRAKHPARIVGVPDLSAAKGRLMISIVL
jgi:hypothetical protein